MCGIAGVVGHPDAHAVVAKMTSLQVHRGPESGAVRSLTPEVAFGHRRLAILDLSERGAQPMTSFDGRWTIVLNGEIFNYRELRSELGDVFWRSETDTEVFVEAIARWGLEATLRRCNGMFGAALWDSHQRALFLARDRVGEKPLIYYWDGEVFGFASELKALSPLHDSRLDPTAVDLYLALGYVPAPAAIFRATHKLPPGHLARLRNRELQVRRWWFPENASTQPAPDVRERREQVRDLVKDAVRLRLRADVPIALALSGGVDSSAIATELAESNTASRAFTVIFEKDTSDLSHAQAVAKRFGMDHEIIEADRQALPDQIESSFGIYDEPFADSSTLACTALAHNVASRYKVILNGDGGDEAFGGYRHYEFISAKQRLKAAAALVGLRDGHATSTVYVQSKTAFRTKERQVLLNGYGQRVQALDEFLISDSFLRRLPQNPLKRALWSDRHLPLANALTYKMDMSLAAHGIEGRAPLLDHRILEWSQNLPNKDLVRSRQKKVLLCSAYRGSLPDSVLIREKHGFGAPIDEWLAGPLREQAAAMLPCSLLDPKMQCNLVGQRQWALFAFAMWARRWGATW